MRGAIAAGHPLSAEAGARVLAEGGNAVDALLAAAFTSFVTEGPLTGPTGGGFLLVHERGGETILLDCFFAVPTELLGVMEEVLIDFGSGTQIFHVGDGSVAVPGLLAGLEEAHRRFATQPWAALVGPSIDLAREGVACDAPRTFLHRILAPILLRDEGGRQLYGDPERVGTADLVETLERVRDRAAVAAVDLLPEFADDLESYEVVAHAPLETMVLGHRLLATPRPSRGGGIVVQMLEMLAAAGNPSLRDEARALEIAYGESAVGPLTGTTHVSVVDAAGHAAALSSTLGSGSGVFRSGTQLNNMLGELDVIGLHERAPRTRLPSMLTPTLLLDGEDPRLVLGSAGSVRLAGAIAQVAWRVVRWSTPVAQAIDAPRVHVEGSTLHLEGGWPDEDVRGLDAWDVVRWNDRNLYFGGVQAVEVLSDGTLAAAGDPRRGGVGLVVE